MVLKLFSNPFLLKAFGNGARSQVTLAMELKVWADKRPDPLKEGLPQLDKYLSGLSLDTGWLVIFDRRSGLPPLSDRTTTENVISPAGREIIVIRG